MTDHPADLLTTAAEILRSAATGAIHGGRTTWQLGSTLGTRTAVVLDNQDTPTVLIETYAERLERVNAYLALVGPATGLAVADWLTHEAVYQRHLDETGQDGAEDSTHALAVARAVLGQDGGQP
ncbi:hypothetical protein ACFVXQ_00115 [Kitasatospora sp. NPDC058263]